MSTLDRLSATVRERGGLLADAVEDAADAVPTPHGDTAAAGPRAAMTDPGPTRTSAAVPKASARARCDMEYIFWKPPLSDCCSTMSNEFRKVNPP